MSTLLDQNSLITCCVLVMEYSWKFLVTHTLFLGGLGWASCGKIMSEYEEKEFSADNDILLHILH